MYKNQAHDLYNAGSDITVSAKKKVKGRTFATITGEPNPHGNVQAETATNSTTIAGVFKYDANPGDLVGLARGASRVVLVAIETELAPGQEVQANATGLAAPVSDGTPVGYVFAKDTDQTAYISLYH